MIFNRKMLLSTILFVFTIFIVNAAIAQENPSKVIERALSFYKSNKFVAAWSELDWAQKEIAKLIYSDVEKMLPVKISGYRIEKKSSGGVFGLSQVSRNYIKNDDQTNIEVKVITSLGSRPSGMGAILQMSQWAQNMNIGNNLNEPIRIEGKGGQLFIDQNKKTGKITFSLQNNVIVIIEAHGEVNREMLINFAKSVSLVKIEKYFQK